MMIFDGHAYCFPPITWGGGFGSGDQLRRHLQVAIANHRQPVWRLRDRVLADTSGLIDPDRKNSLDGLKEAHFRGAGYGRFEWTVGQEEYVKQYLAPSAHDMSAPPEYLVSEMDYAGVDWALLHRNPYLGIGNDFIASCVQRFPNRLKGLAHVEEWLIETDPEEAVQKLEKAVRQGLSGLQFLPGQRMLYGQRGPWDSEGFRPFWDGVAELGIPVFFTLSPHEQPLAGSYLNELKTLQRWMERYSDVTVIQTHGLQWDLFREGESVKLPEAVWAPFDNPNLHLQLLIPIALGGVWDFPMPQIWPTLEECAKRVGTNRLLWGTDMPIVLRHWTYKQNIDLIRNYCDFLTSEEKDKILGYNMRRIISTE